MAGDGRRRPGASTVVLRDREEQQLGDHAQRRREGPAMRTSCQSREEGGHPSSSAAGGASGSSHAGREGRRRGVDDCASLASSGSVVAPPPPHAGWKGCRVAVRSSITARCLGRSAGRCSTTARRLGGLAASSGCRDGGGVTRGGLTWTRVLPGQGVQGWSKEAAMACKRRKWCGKEKRTHGSRVSR